LQLDDCRLGCADDGEGVQNLVVDQLGDLVPGAALGHGVNVALRARAHTPVLLDAGYHERIHNIPWWDGRQLSYSFPPA
jgi:hypothetical protein